MFRASLLPTKPDPIAAFLERSGWGDASSKPLAGDASHRRYERLSEARRKAVLMIAPPETGEDTRPFTRAARHLTGLGLSAPAIIADDPATGLLLIEDLGDDLFARIAERRPDLEAGIYRNAVDVLAHIHAQPLPEWAEPYDRDALVDRAGLAFDWYAGHPAPAGVVAELRLLFDDTPGLTDTLVLRDYHAENLLWLPGRAGLARTGLLDFQDAMAGHRAYDLVSLIEDARRDLAPDRGGSLVDRYLARTGLPEKGFRRAYALLGAQRNLRILGVFARLAIRDGKPGYLQLIPRVWAHLQTDLTHPALSRLRDLVLDELPEPVAAHIEHLTERCARTP